MRIYQLQCIFIWFPIIGNMGHFGGHFGGHFDVPREIRKVVIDKKLTDEEKFVRLERLMIEHGRKIDDSWKNWKPMAIGFGLGVIASSVASLIIMNLV